jgi:hypothetical protein
MTTRQLAETPTFGLWYDFRNRAEWRQPAGQLYRGPPSLLEDAIAIIRQAWTGLREARASPA